ncbi:hypothetical protein HDV05_001523 [Chytridiales sp. JEL 0842]|nr:hypothetical protein HDV05_001523 [Chytridiales sp. JEL 0842]
MADRRATNKYYPPDWDPSKGSINTFVGQHPLRDRARKLDQGILIISGARKREEEFSAEDAGTMELKDDAEAEKLNDPMYKLEHGIADVQKAKEAAPVLSQLQDVNDKYWKDPFALSQKLRKRFRDEKKEIQQQKNEADEFRDKHHLSIDILPASVEDEEAAKRIKFADAEIPGEEVIKQVVHQSSIFATTKKDSSTRQRTPGRFMKPDATPTPSTATTKSTSRIKSSRSSSKPTLRDLLASQKKDPFAVKSAFDASSFASTSHTTSNLGVKVNKYSK